MDGWDLEKELKYILKTGYSNSISQATINTCTHKEVFKACKLPEHLGVGTLLQGTLAVFGSVPAPPWEWATKEGDGRFTSVQECLSCVIIRRSDGQSERKDAAMWRTKDIVAAGAGEESFTLDMGMLGTSLVFLLLLQLALSLVVREYKPVPLPLGRMAD